MALPSILLDRLQKLEAEDHTQGRRSVCTVDFADCADQLSAAEIVRHLQTSAACAVVVSKRAGDFQHRGHVIRQGQNSNVCVVHAEANVECVGVVLRGQHYVVVVVSSEANFEVAERVACAEFDNVCRSVDAGRDAECEASVAVACVDVVLRVGATNNGACGVVNSVEASLVLSAIVVRAAAVSVTPLSVSTVPLKVKRTADVALVSVPSFKIPANP